MSWHGRHVAMQLAWFGEFLGLINCLGMAKWTQNGVLEDVLTVFVQIVGGLKQDGMNFLGFWVM